MSVLLGTTKAGNCISTPTKIAFGVPYRINCKTTFLECIEGNSTILQEPGNFQQSTSDVDPLALII